MIKEIDFSGVVNWDVKNYFRQFNVFKKDVRIVPFGFFITKPEIEKVKIEDSKEYRILGVRSYGKGAYINREVKGSSLKMRTYQLAKKDRLFWCKVDTKNGAFGIINEELEDGVASSNMTFADINTQKANTEYIQILFRSTKVNEYMDGYVTGTTNRKYIKPDQLRGEIKIPLPPKVEQDRIVATYNQKIKLAKRQEEKAKQLEQDIETYLFDVLGIEKVEEQQKTKGLNFISYEFLDVWGADRLLRGGLTNVLESKKYPNKKLNQLIDVNPRTDLNHLMPDDKMSFIPMKNVSDDYGLVLKKDEGIKSKSKGYTKFKNGDLIWARITPCMQNGKSAIVNDLHNGLGYGSTEYHVLRQINQDYNINFLYHLLRIESVLNDAVNHFTGSAGQQRVPKTYLENLLIPYPPKEIQIQVANHVSILKSEIKNLREQAEQNRKQAITDFENEIFS
ncbi:restriction endonuclease subunit S [Tenacibaculum maritimum]|uniref:restriction endonuclease subunit S n=1 Tax=Tenacibaculum maritimum TaxID=107401 RepID=UPI0014562349|nr:restriction endonuclease subunit S [Tenacibaculum maritimum]